MLVQVALSEIMTTFDPGRYEGIPIADTGLTPLGAFELSFIFASLMSAGYAIVFPVLVYIETDIILLSDVSVYFLLGAVALFLTGRTFDYTEQKLRT